MRISSQLDIDEQEFEVLTTTSRGPGGQHVNRSETRVVLRWNVLESASLTEEQRARLLEKLGSRISREGVLQVAAEDHRSQTRNRELARERLADLVSDALRQERQRKPTRPTVPRRSAASTTRRSAVRSKSGAGSRTMIELRGRPDLKAEPPPRDRSGGSSVLRLGHPVTDPCRPPSTGLRPAPSQPAPARDRWSCR